MPFTSFLSVFQSELTAVGCQGSYSVIPQINRTSGAGHQLFFSPRYNVRFGMFLLLVGWGSLGCRRAH